LARASFGLWLSELKTAEIMGRPKRLTITDIARIAGVSRTTASMVLNGHVELYRISTVTQERVLSVARENRFLPSQLARALRSGRSQTIGLVIPELTSYAQNRLAQAMEPICQQAGYQMLLVTSNDDPLQERAGVELLMAREVDGLILVPSSPDPENYLKWSGQLPLVLVDRRLPENASLPFVVTDAKTAMAEMMAGVLHEIDEAYYFGGPPELSPCIDRLDGYRAALAKAGLKERKNWVCSVNFRRSSGYTLMKECYCRLGRYPRFLVTGAITLLEGALSFISENAHFDIAPERIVTFDDHILLDCLPLRIDSIEQDDKTLAKESFARLARLINDEKVDSCRVPAKLHWRSR
jgi:LacI family sucrose operon transcriptional repressor